MTYKLTHSPSTITRLSDSASIPCVQGNSDYAEYLRWRDGWTQEIREPRAVTTLVDREPDETHPEPWQEEVTSWEMVLVDTVVHPPHEPEPADPLPPPVYILDAADFRINLRRLGLRETVETAIANSGNGELQDLWEYKTEIHSDNPVLIEFANSIGLGDRLLEVFTVDVRV